MDLLEAMDKKIEAVEAELKALKTARNVLSPAQSGTPEVEIESTSNLLGDTGVIDLDDLGLPPKKVTKKNTLSDAVIGVIKRFDKQEFTVNHVVAALIKMGKVTTNPKHYKNRVSAVIRKLSEDNGLLERTHEGGGNDPHKYKEKEESPQMALVNNDG